MGSTAKMGQGVVVVHVIVPVGKRGPARVQFNAEVSVTAPAVILPGPGTPFRRAPVGEVFRPVVTAVDPCWEVRTLNPCSA